MAITRQFTRVILKQNSATGDTQFETGLSLSLKTDAGALVATASEPQPGSYLFSWTAFDGYGYIWLGSTRMDVWGHQWLGEVVGNKNLDGTFQIDQNTTISGTLLAAGVITSNGLQFGSDNSYDIGASASGRPRDVYVGRNAVIGGTATIGGTTTVNGGNLISGDGTGTARVYLIYGDPSTQVLDLAFAKTNTTLSRWFIRVSGTESGSDAGSDMAFLSRTDAGAAKTNILKLYRADSRAEFAGNVNMANAKLFQWAMTSGNTAYVEGNGTELLVRGGSGGTRFRNNADSANTMTLSDAGALLAPSLQSNGHIYIVGTYYTLNKATTGWLPFATRYTGGSEAVVNLTNVGTLAANGVVALSGGSSTAYGLGMTNAIRILNGNTSAPSTANQVVAGDKIIFWDDTTNKYAIGMSTGGVLWYQTQLKHSWYASTTPVQTMTLDNLGNLTPAKSVQNTYATGWLGTGYILDYDMTVPGYSYMELDRLRVRGQMDIYELVVNQIRATNGAEWISSVAKVDSIPAANDVIFQDPTGNNLQPFAVNDLVMCQVWKNDASHSASVRLVQAAVTAINVAGDTKRVTVSYSTGGPFQSGDTVVRIGNTSTAARQNAIYLTADDTNNPYIDVLAGVDSFAHMTASSSIKVRLGNLAGITDTEMGGALSGYGFYTGQGYFKGNIFVKSSVSQVLQNGAIQIGNITGTANSALKIANTGTAGTSGLYGYTAAGAESFAIRCDGTAQIGGWVFDAGTLSRTFDTDRTLKLDTGAGTESIYFYDATPASGDARFIGMGKLFNGTAWTTERGIGAVTYNGSTYDKVFWLSETTKQIAGWSFDATKFSKGSIAIESSTEKLIAGNSGTDASGASVRAVLGKYDGTHYGMRVWDGTSTYLELGDGAKSLAGWQFTDAMLWKEYNPSAGIFYQMALDSTSASLKFSYTSTTQTTFPTTRVELAINYASPNYFLHLKTGAALMVAASYPSSTNDLASFTYNDHLQVVKITSGGSSIVNAGIDTANNIGIDANTPYLQLSRVATGLKTWYLALDASGNLGVYEGTTRRVHLNLGATAWAAN